MSPLFGEVQSGLSPTPRELRRLAAAVALGRGEPIPIDAIPPDYLPLMKAVHAARANGQSWSKALAGVGLVLPGDEQMLERIDVLREELRSTWPQVQFVLSALQRSGNAVAVDQTMQKVRTLMI